MTDTKPKRGRPRKPDGCKERVSLRLPESTCADLEQAAERHDTSIPKIHRKALSIGLSELLSEG